MNIVLIIVLIILIINGFYGLKVGFIKTMFSIFSMIIALLLSAWFAPTVSKMLRENENVMNYVSEKIEMVLPLDDIGNKITDQISFIDDLALPQILKNAIIENNNTETYLTLSVDDFSEYISRYIASIIINAVSFTITFACISILLRILCFVLDIISKLPILNQINKIAGLLAGLLHGFIIIYILGIFVTIFSGTAVGQEIFQMIESSPFLKLIYNHNFILNFLTDISRMLL